MNYLTIILTGLLCLCLNVQAQQTVFDSVYFNNSALLNEELEYMYGVTSSNNYSFGAILGSNVITNKRNTYIIKNDSIGKTIKKYNYDNETIARRNPTAVTILNDKLYVVGNHINNIVQDTGNMFIQTFNLNLDSLNYNYYPFPWVTGQFNNLIAKVGYLYGTGFITKNDGSYGDLFVAKFDTLGNLIWVNNYGQTNKNETGITLQLIGNDSLFIGGYSNEGTNGSSGLAILLDTAGTELWRRYIDMSGKENIFGGGFKHKDGGFMMVGSYYVPPNGESELCATKLNSSGIRLWDKFYSLGPSSEGTDYCFYDPIDSTIIAVGGNLNVPQFHEAGLAVKYTMEGDTMWTRTYDKSYNLNGYIDHFYKGITTNDGGYLFAGQTSSGVIPGKTDAWLLKTDSIGCHPNYPCWPATHYNYTGLKTEAYKSFNLTVFPNPATNYVCVKFKNLNQNNACTLKLYNVTGQLVKQQTFNYVNPIALLNLDNVEQGMYVLEVETLYCKERMKIVKE